MTLAMPDPGHRMADPVVRRRTAAVVAVLLGLAWAAVSLVGRPAGPFSQEELRHLGGVPFAPPQIQRRIPPQAPLGDDLSRQIMELQRGLQGTQGSASPSPGSR